MSTPAEDPALTAEMQRFAAQQAGSQAFFNTQFDFSEQSLTRMDEVISKFFPNGNALDTTLLPFGAYVGETIRHNLGGVWVQEDEEHGCVVADVGGCGIRAFPFAWVRKRFANGMEDSVAYKFTCLKAMVEKERGAPIDPVAPILSATPAPTVEATAEDYDALARSLMVVFFLVAGADGKVDKKEYEAFPNTLEQMRLEAGSLLAQSMDRMDENVDRYGEELSNDPFKDSSSLLQELKRVGGILKQSFPAESVSFQMALIELGVKIAESSGGFLGFGNKISKEEMAVLAAIAASLKGADLPE